MANHQFLPLAQSLLSNLEVVYPPVRLMVNFDFLHDAYIIRASVGPVVAQQYIYHHEVYAIPILPEVMNLFHERALSAIRELVPDQREMQGASEYDEIMQGEEIMNDLSRGG